MPRVSQISLPLLVVPDKHTLQQSDTPGAPMHFSTEWEMSAQPEKLSDTVKCGTVKPAPFVPITLGFPLYLLGYHWSKVTCLDIPGILGSAIRLSTLQRN